MCGNNWEWNSNPPAQNILHNVLIHAPQGLCAVPDIKSLSAITLINCPNAQMYHGREV